MFTTEEQKSRGGGNPLLSSLIKKSKQISAMGMVGIVALILTTSVVVAPVTSWLLSISRSVGESNSRLEAVTVSQSEWERLQHMSLGEIRANKTALATPYNVGDGFQVKVNLGAEGYFSGGKCGNIPSGKNANCFKDTTITVFNSDGDRLFSSRQLPLQVGLYTTEEIDSKLTALKNDYTTKINNEGTARANADNSLTARLNGKEFVKNRTTSYDLNFRYEKKAEDTEYSLHAYNGDTEIPLSSQGGGGFPDLSKPFTISTNFSGTWWSTRDWNYNPTYNYVSGWMSGTSPNTWSGTVNINYKLIYFKQDSWCKTNNTVSHALVNNEGITNQYSNIVTWTPYPKGSSISALSYGTNDVVIGPCYPAK